MDRLSNFYTNSTVSSFKNRLKKAGHNENVLVDFDGRAYIRIMKRLTQIPKCHLNFPEQSYDNINLNEEFNKDFHLRFYIPKNIISTIGAKADRVMIMFNGLNELEHYHFYDMLGEFFATNGIAAILLPTPLNLNRRIEKDFNPKNIKLSFWPSSRADSGNELLFFYSYFKSYSELNFLIDKIRGEYPELDNETDFNFYSNYFNEDCEISLLGYSLGGLKALSYFSKDFLPLDENKKNDDVYVESYYRKTKWEQKLHSCITINTGPNLFEVDTSNIGIGKKEWLELLDRVQEKIIQEKDKSLLDLGDSDDVKDLINFYRFLYINDKKNGKVMEFGHDKVRGVLNNYLAISGGTDPIVTTDQMQRIAPPLLDENGKIVTVEGAEKKMSINQLIVANGDHHPAMETSEWHEVLPMVEENILEFMNSCGYRHYKRKEILDKIKLLLIKLKKEKHTNPINILKNKFCSEETHNFSEKDMKLILDNLTLKNDKEMFMRYYYRSKAFFPHFHEVMKRILSKIP